MASLLSSFLGLRTAAEPQIPGRRLSAISMPESEQTIASDREDIPQPVVASHHYSAIIRVLVGHEAKPFLLHEHHICEASNFFRKACVNAPTIDGTKVVHVADLPPAVFQAYCVWIYSGKIDETMGTFFEEHPMVQTYDHIEQQKLIAAWTVGDHLDDDKLRRDSMIKLLHSVDRFEGCAACITFAYKHADAHSSICKFVADAAVGIKDPAQFELLLEKIPEAAKSTITKTLQRLRVARRSKWFKQEDYARYV